MSIQPKTIKRLLLLSSLILFSVFHFSTAQTPNIQTPTPVIHLADNLDEKDNLGWCIDTVGRGFAEKLHAHSCKPRGGDVQFSYDNESLNIQSVPFDNKCVTLDSQRLEQNSTESESAEDTNMSAFMLIDCETDNAGQRFIYDEEALSFHPETHLDLCIAVGEASRSAGPYMSRTLQLTICTETDSELWQWIILDEGNN